MVCQEAELKGEDYKKFLRFVEKLNQGAGHLGFFEVYSANQRVFGGKKIPDRPYVHTHTTYQESPDKEHPNVLICCDDFKKEVMGKISFVSNSTRLFEECVEKIKEISGLEKLSFTPFMDVVRIGP